MSEGGSGTSVWERASTRRLEQHDEQRQPREAVEEAFCVHLSPHTSFSRAEEGALFRKRHSVRTVDASGEKASPHAPTDNRRSLRTSSRGEKARAHATRAARADQQAAQRELEVARPERQRRRSLLPGPLEDLLKVDPGETRAQSACHKALVSPSVNP